MACSPSATWANGITEVLSEVVSARSHTRADHAAPYQSRQLQMMRALDYFIPSWCVAGVEQRARTSTNAGCLGRKHTAVGQLLIQSGLGLCLQEDAEHVTQQQACACGGLPQKLIVQRACLRHAGAQPEAERSTPGRAARWATQILEHDNRTKESASIKLTHVIQLCHS